MYFRVPKRFSRSRDGISKQHQTLVYVDFLSAAINYTKRTGRSCLVRHFMMYARYWRDNNGIVRVEHYFPHHISPSPEWKAQP